jgi:hypothetical protein
LAASRLMHPSSMLSTATELEPDVLADMAGGLAASVDPTVVPAADPRSARGRVLLAGPGYEARLERIDGGSVLLAGGGSAQAAAFAVVDGAVLVWTSHDGSHALGPGATCALAARDRLQVMNFGPAPALVVTVQAVGAQVAPVANLFRPSRSLVR